MYQVGAFQPPSRYAGLRVLFDATARPTCDRARLRSVGPFGPSGGESS